ADNPGHEAVARVVEDLDRPQPYAGGDDNDTPAVVVGADDAGDVRAVTVAVIPPDTVRRSAVVPTHDVEVGVVALDAGVDDGNVGFALATVALDVRDRVVRGAHPLDAGRHLGRRQLDLRLGQPGADLFGLQVDGGIGRNA